MKKPSLSEQTLNVGLTKSCKKVVYQLSPNRENESDRQTSIERTIDR